jgi:hypothetical protein
MLVHTTAIHEASHAVPACALRIKFEHVALNKARKPRTCLERPHPPKIFQKFERARGACARRNEQ